MIRRLLFLLLLPAIATAGVPAKAVQIAGTLIGTTEATGRNDGPMIKRILASVGLPEGNPYCAATVVYCYGKAAEPKANPVPKIARVSMMWKRVQINPARYRCFRRAQILAGLYQVQPGDVGIMLFGSGPNPNGHTFLLTDQRGRRFGSYEGNTSPTDKGSQREGGGIYAKERNLSSLAGVFRVRS